MTHRHLLLGTALIGLIAGISGPAQAQYHNYIRTEEPSVSVDLSVLGLPQADEPSHATAPAAAALPAEAVAQEPLPSEAQATDTYVAPTKPPVLKPDASQLATDERTATPAAAKAYNPYLTTPAKGRYVPSPSVVDTMTPEQVAALHGRPAAKSARAPAGKKGGIVLASASGVDEEGPDGRITPIISQPPGRWTPGAPAAPEVRPAPSRRPSLVEVPMEEPSAPDAAAEPAKIPAPAEPAHAAAPPADDFNRKVDLTLPPEMGAAPAPQPAPRPAAPESTDVTPAAEPAPALAATGAPEIIEPPSDAEMETLADKMASATEEMAAAPAMPDAGEDMPTVPSVADLTLSFVGNSSDLTAEAQKKLDAVVRQLRDITGGRLQVRGFAAGEDGSKSSARRIALSRVLSVRSYLMDKGVKPTRVDVRAMGSETDRGPLDRVDLVFAR